MLAAFMLFLAPKIDAQVYVVKQVFVGSGGNYGDPDDYVGLSSYDPMSGQSNDFGTVFTQSIQDLIIKGEFLYVAAQDSIAKYNATTYERLAIAPAVGVNKLAVYEDKLLATFAYPVSENFLRIYSADNLEMLTTISEISDEAANMLIVDDMLYVAVPGGWASTIGKMALIDLNDLLFLKEVDLGSEAAGIFNLYLYDNRIVSVNKSAWGVNSGYLTQVNTALTEFSHHIFPYGLGAGVGLLNNSLYVQMDGGVGEVDLIDMTLVNSSVVEPIEMGIAAAVLDTVNSLFYVTSTDYTTEGYGYVFDMSGENTAVFEAGISPEALAIDYQLISDVYQQKLDLTLSAFPNPASDLCHLDVPTDLAGAVWAITDLQGRTFLKGRLSDDEKQLTIDISSLLPGMYISSVNNHLAQGMVKILVN